MVLEAMTGQKKIEEIESQIINDNKKGNDKNE